MWMLAGNTATSTPVSHQRPSLRVGVGRTISPPAISAAPLQLTASSGLIGTYSGTVAPYSRARRKCIVPAKIQKMPSSVRDRLTRGSSQVRPA